MPNLVKLFTIRGPLMIDTRQLNDEHYSVLTIYTLDGIRKVDAARDERERLLASYGVHRENLYASIELAHTAHREMNAMMTKRHGKRGK